nr:hypothetical protein [Kitasatospora cheerisanensis]
MVAEFRSSAVVVPQDADGALWAGDEGGVRWIHAFTDEAELAAFAGARGFTGSEIPYLTVLGSRLLDVAVPAAGVPCGVALNAAGAQPMLFPPVRGVVPDASSVDARAVAGAAAAGGRF